MKFIILLVKIVCKLPNSVFPPACGTALAHQS